MYIVVYGDRWYKALDDRHVKDTNEVVSWLFPDGNVCSSQSYVSSEQRRLCSGSTQARLIFGSGLLRSAHPR
jgi:hypothetical protein